MRTTRKAAPFAAAALLGAVSTLVIQQAAYAHGALTGTIAAGASASAGFLGSSPAAPAFTDVTCG